MYYVYNDSSAPSIYAGRMDDARRIARRIGGAWVIVKVTDGRQSVVATGWE